ncbi:MAG: 2Fe-2S iron-sulfur cluster binding domain-containing protein, partial [Actinomycetia bacterium]|nr:2Fe-2S iron-sulfur cluster binding domain-containing protein [Actinomycetes bacterium]
MPIVTFLPANKRVEIDSGEDLLQAAAKANIHVNASCGGEGTCGKCKVLVSGNRVDSDSAGRLSETEIAKGYVLACKTQVFKDLTIKIPVESELLAKRRTKIKTLTSSLDSWNEQLAALKVDPPLTKRYFELVEPSLSDAVSDLTRINRALKREFRVSDVKIDLDIVKKLPDILRDGKWRIT